MNTRGVRRRAALGRQPLLGWVQIEELDHGRAGSGFSWRETAAELEAAYQREQNIHRQKRLHALWLIRSGEIIGTVAEAVGVDARIIQRWLAMYRTGGIDELLRRVPGHQAAGRTPRLTIEQRTILHARMTDGQLRTIREAITWVQTEWGATYTYQGMYHLLRQSSSPNRSCLHDS